MRADLEHLARPPDPRVRDPEVRRRPRRARTSSSRSHEELAREKVALVCESFPSQRDKHWFDEELFLGLMRLRGMEAARRAATPRRSPAASSRSWSHDLRARPTSTACGSIEPERLEDERGFFARTWDTARVRAARAECATRPVQHLVQPTRAGRCGDSTTRRPRTRRRSSCAARPARSSTSPSTSGRTPRPTCDWVGVELSAENRLALYVPEGCAHGFLTLDGRLGGALPDLRVLRAGRRPRRALGRSGFRRSRGRARSWSINDRDRTYPDFQGGQ